MQRRHFTIAAVGLSMVLGGCNLFTNSFVGKSYVNKDRTGYYDFVSKDHAEFSLIPSESVVQCDLPEIGVSYLTSSQDLTDYNNFYVVRSGTGLLSFYAVKPGAKISVSQSGVISAQENTDTRSDAIVSLSPNSSDGSISQRSFANLVQRCNESSFFGVAYDSSGTRLENTAALSRMLASSDSDDNNGFGAVRFDATREFNAGQKKLAAVVPYEVTNKTLSLDWKAAELTGGSFEANRAFRDYLDRLLVHELVIFRIEDDGKFLYNPETESRFKQE